MDVVLIREGLELPLKKVNYEITRVEARLNSLARRFGLKERRELEELMRSKSVDNPEVDLAWPEYMYLRERLNTH